jgi:hypothetical protein
MQYTGCLLTLAAWGSDFFSPGSVCTFPFSCFFSFGSAAGLNTSVLFTSSLVECCPYIADCLLLQAFLYPAGGSTSPRGLASFQLCTEVFSAGASVAFPLLEECSWCSKARVFLSCQFIPSLGVSGVPPEGVCLSGTLKSYYPPALWPRPLTIPGVVLGVAQ